MNDLLKNAQAASAPATLTAPNARENKPTSDALGTQRPRAPSGARSGAVTLSNGITLHGAIWSTLETPLRLWVDGDKTYHDIDLALIQRIDVHVLAQTMEDDWRWLKEGSDQKVYSGKKYPLVDLAYRCTLLNGQVVEGTIAAPLYVLDGARPRSLALYKKYKGGLDETLKDVVYITSISLNPADLATVQNSRATTKLPLLDD